MLRELGNEVHRIEHLHILFEILGILGVKKHPRLVVFEKHAESLWDGEYELAVRQVEKYVFGEMFGEQQRPFLMT